MTEYAFLSGTVVCGFMVAAVFFLRFWKRTRDVLFLAFAGAFLLMGIAQGLLALGGFPVEERSWIYLIRLAAFMLILLAVFGKNHSSRSR